jgi:isopropylmalate/homocitrate/citramalate synthase
MSNEWNKPWTHAMWDVSPYNFSSGLQSDPKRRIEIHDTTLRDGLSDPARGIFAGTQQKVEIARILDDLGIRRTEIGLTTRESLEELKAFGRAGLKAKTFAMTPTSSFKWKDWEAIDIALEAGLSGVVLNFPMSRQLVNHFLPGWSMEQILEKSVGMARYAKEKGLFVNFFPYDTTRAEPDFLERLLKSAVGDAHVDTVSIIDTLGVGSPYGIASMVKLIKQWVNVPIELHMHNDFNLALANTLAGVENGGSAVHTTINGIGKMPATEDVATCVRILYGVECGINYGDLFDCCNRIREIGRWELDLYRPISGKYAFGYDSDERLNENRSQKAPFLPEFIGHQYHLVVSGRTGVEGIRWNLKRLGKDASEEQIKRISTKIAEEWGRKGRPLRDEEFKAVVEGMI